MKRIYKYQIPLQGRFSIRLPAGAVCLSAQAQYNTPQLWALVDIDAPDELREFALVGTGHDITETLGRHVGSFQMNNGQLVWHVFEMQL